MHRRHLAFVGEGEHSAPVIQRKIAPPLTEIQASQPLFFSKERLFDRRILRNISSFRARAIVVRLPSLVQAS
jgi:hypothetical protein